MPEEWKYVNTGVLVRHAGDEYVDLGNVMMCFSDGTQGDPRAVQGLSESS